MENKTKENFILKKQYEGEIKTRNVEELGFNTIVISGICVVPVSEYRKIGRLVQVRKGSGAFGTDTVLLRLMDGDLQSFHNQYFYSVAKEFKAEVEEYFKDTELDTEDNLEFSIEGRHVQKGFIIPEGTDDTDGKVYSFAITEKKEGKNTHFKIQNIE